MEEATAMESIDMDVRVSKAMKLDILKVLAIEYKVIVDTVYIGAVDMTIVTEAMIYYSDTQCRGILTQL